jgi:Ni,Fe-hydrogenase III small subunit/ferredoxin-like protein FixX
MKWVLSGIRTGIRTSAYPRAEERAAGVTPGLPVGAGLGAEAAALVARCPTHALDERNGAVSVDYRRCVHCGRCRPALAWRSDYEWAGSGGERGDLGAAFRRSAHVLVVDAGDCGACLNEVRQLNNPYYNMHRLGFFITPTPRHADVLLVVGPVTDHMRVALKKIYDAMPTPKRVVAVGACALSGGVFAESFVCGEGARTLLPVDVEVPGNPPPPLAILHGLLVAVGRRPPAALVSEPGG